MLTRNLSNKIIDIRLEEEKFYFPGETIKGCVIVQPKSAIKVNSIQLKFTGVVYINLKEKEITTLFEKIMTLSVHPDSTNIKPTLLNPIEHKFKFSFILPNNLNLPSSMEFGKKANIRYLIHAILDRPMIPEQLSPKADYSLSLLEYIDIEQVEFKSLKENYQEIRLPKAKYNQQSSFKASIPRSGFTRGDIIHVNVIVNHFETYSRKNGVTIDLVRIAEIRTSKHTLFKEAILKSNTYDLHLILSPLRPCQHIFQSQLLIPTSTPPTIRYKEKTLRFQYKVSITLKLRKQTYTMDIPIVIGTWPRSAIPIDDDDEEDINQYHLNSQQFDEDDEDIESLKTSSIDDFSSIKSSPRLLPSISLYHHSTPNLVSPHQTRISRSDSITSDNSSLSSWQSSPSPTPLSRNSSYRNSIISFPHRLSRPDSTFIPNHTLEPIHPTFPSNYNFTPTHTLEPIECLQENNTDHNVTPIITTTSFIDLDSDSDDDSDDDLLSIIRKKEKQKGKK